MLPKPPDCPIPGARGFMRPEGTGSLGVLMLGEAAGSHEVREGLPFRPTAPAGSVLERAIKRAGYERQQFRIWNMIGCQPPNNKLDHAPYEQAALSHCKPRLDALIAEMKPRCIMTLGAVPTRALTGMTGHKQSIGLLRGFLLPSLDYDCPVLPSYHPSYLRRGAKGKDESGAAVKGEKGGGMSLFGVLVADIHSSVRATANSNDFHVVREGERKHYTQEFRVNTEDEILAFAHFVKDNAGLPLSYDIETPMSGKLSEEETDELVPQCIESVQFWCGGQHLFIHWTPTFIPLIKKILACSNDKVGCNNWKFDDPHLRSNGCYIGGVIHDMRWAWHHLQPDLPANLQFIASFYDFPFPWKHLNVADPAVYGICDVWATDMIYAGIIPQMKEWGILRGYEQHVLGLEPILCSMSKRGMPVDPVEHKKLSVVYKEDVKQQLRDMQTLVPDEVKTFTPPKGYKREPKDTSGMIEKEFTIDMSDAQGDGIMDDTAIVQAAINGSCIRRWVKLKPFKPSATGLFRYMAHMNHTPPTNKDGKPTTAELELKRLAKSTKDPLYNAVVDYRETLVIANNHLPNWKPGEDGRVHSTFYFDPATGQLSSRRPNTQNAPRRKENAAAFRALVRARPGHVLLDFDYKSFHVMTLGFEAEDADYCRIARIDMHAFLTSYMVKQSVPFDLPDDEMTERLRWIRKNYKYIRDNQAKTAVLGYGFGLTDWGMFMRNRDHFAHRSDAKKVFDIFDALFPKTKQFRDDVRRLAHDKGYLVSKHGYIRHFWAVRQWQQGLGWKPGPDSEAAISFLPSNDGFGHIKDSMVRLDDMGWLEKAQFINQEHDDLKFEPPLKYEEEARVVIKAEMEKASTILINSVAPGGLVVGVGVKRGLSWDKMEDV